VMESPKADDGWQVSFVAPHLEVRCSGNGRGMFVRDRSVKKGQVLVVWSGVLLLVQLPSPEFKCSTKRTGGGLQDALSRPPASRESPRKSTAT